jgi:hippurate hydrolase
VHRHPEVGLHLPYTQQLIIDALQDLPLELTLGEGLSSVTAVLRGSIAGPTVLLRADMDALPVSEAAQSDIRSEVDGVMHACGHDLHVATLIGAARLLSQRQDELAGDVVFMFQPGEEGFNGAGMMIDEGVLMASGTRPIAAYALHVTSAHFERGVFAARTGPMMAASDVLSVTVHGAGGHGSAPHLAQDPVPVACEAVLAIQTLVTRTLDVFDPAVVTVGTFHAGTKGNVIPGSAAFEATIRSFSAETRSKLYETLPRLIVKIAEGHGLSADVGLTEQYPVMNNHGPETDFLAQTVRDLFGPDGYRTMSAPLTSSEDFSRVLDEVPGAYVMVGACPTGLNPATAAYNHAPEAEFDESVMKRGAELFAGLAIRRLAQAAQQDQASAVKLEEKSDEPATLH